ncbi:hypothetical protein [Methylobacterium nodulans]|uniref:Secreted protein n=1 Tax=Methylobacterium nodulans (strain LMG 21967 / CNCM I-2342 / ORS 2060) TaxID=460265 RepID=B8IC26_METNO|nr:hypothetical protein [Methylobacterium nodulans]ACL61208.1 conserved hypothetical protein [Methylobacterium nodulans ORS 2060]
MMSAARILVVGGLLLLPVAAQAQADADRTGTGGGPGTTITAPYTRSTGQTVPRAGEADRALERRIDDLTREEKRDDAIDSSICTDCE